MLFRMMMMSTTPWQKVSVPLTILLMSTSKTEPRLLLKEKLMRNLGGMFPQEVAVLDSGGSNA